jgi:glyoxylase-like metal-dependent hydrolase (beta-lactamase superfamily II)
MAEVKLLIPGYAVKRVNGWTASPNTTLITDRGKKVLVDPGSHHDILERLELHSIWPEEIDVVFLTHYHLDHTLNTSQFKEAVVIDQRWVYDDEVITEHRGVIPGTGIEVLKTPGHTLECSSLLVDTTGGTVAVCGDLFWFQKDKMVDPERDTLIRMKDELAVDQELLEKSRRIVLDRAWKIIPGHGSPFLVERYQ